MAKYLLIYKGGTPPQTPEEGIAVMAAWTAWFTKIGTAVVDKGNPTGASKTVINLDTISDVTSSIGGYSILQASNLDSAVELARDCPALQNGGHVEVFETLNVM